MRAGVRAGGTPIAAFTHHPPDSADADKIGQLATIIKVDATRFLPCDIALKDKTMTSTSELAVTLSAELLEQLKAEAEMLGLPVEWLVASLVADTIDAEEWEPATN